MRNSEKLLATPLVIGYRKVNPKFRCENNIIPNGDALQMLGVTVDDMLKSLISVEKYHNKLQF